MFPLFSTRENHWRKGTICWLFSLIQSLFSRRKLFSFLSITGAYAKFKRAKKWARQFPFCERPVEELAREGYEGRGEAYGGFAVVDETQGVSYGVCAEPEAL